MSKKTFKLSEISNFLDGKLVGSGSLKISEISSLKDATKESVSFFYNKKFLKDLKNSSAGAILVSKDFKDYCNTNYIVVSNVHAAYAKLTQLFFDNKRKNLSHDQSHKFSENKDIQIGKNVFIIHLLLKPTNDADTSLIMYESTI